MEILLQSQTARLDNNHPGCNSMQNVIQSKVKYFEVSFLEFNLGLGWRLGLNLLFWLVPFYDLKFSGNNIHSRSVSSNSFSTKVFMSSAPWIQRSGEYRRENECVFVDGSIITHYQISLPDAAVGTTTAATDRFHSSDRFLMRCPLDVVTSSHLRVFLQFCPFSESQVGSKIYILDSIDFYCVDVKISENILIFGGTMYLQVFPVWNLPWEKRLTVWVLV